MMTASLAIAGCTSSNVIPQEPAGRGQKVAQSQLIKHHKAGRKTNNHVIFLTEDTFTNVTRGNYV
jgi:hypothetical protein